MPRAIIITVYDAAEVRQELARRTGKRDPYSRSRIREIIHKYLPAVEEAGKRYFLTEGELVFLAERLQVRKRAKKY